MKIMPIIPNVITRSAVMASLAVALAAPAAAGLLVYEGFDCAGADLSALQGQAGATSVGFDAASTWGTPVGTIAAPQTLDDIARYNTTGLSIGSGDTTLQVAGGSMTLTHLAHASRYYISRALDVAVSGGQTVYGSYLMNYVTRNASNGRVSVDNPAGNDSSRFHFGGGFGQWNNANTIGYIPGVGNTSVTGITGTNGGGPNLTGTNVGLGTTAITLFSITNVGGTSGSSLMWQYVLNSAQFDNFKAGGLTESELQGATVGTSATQVLQRATYTLAAPNPYPQWGLSDVLTFWWADKALLEVIKLDEIRLATGTNGLDEVTPLLSTKRKLLVCAISYSDDDPPYPTEQTLSDWRSLFFSTTPGQESVNNYTMKNTYGAMGWTGDVVRTPIACAKTTLDYQLWRTQAKASALALGYDYTTYDNVHYIFNSFGGAVGGGWQPGWESWVTRNALGNARYAIRHELSHNLGTGHAATLLNHTSAWSTYGDASDFMGSGHGGHHNGPRKVETGMVTATPMTGNGTYQISPLEYAPTSVPHPQVLTMPSTSVYERIDGWPYYFSYRQPVETDEILTSKFPQVLQGVSIHRWSGTSGPTALIATLTDGGTFTDSQINLSVQQISHDSNSVTISVTISDTPPAAPTNLAASAVSSSQINLTWTDNSGNETEFRIERKTGSGGTWSQIATTGSNTTSFSNTGLSASTTYFYRVRAYNAAGNSAYSNEASATTSGTVPTAPTNMAASAVSQSQINLTWTDNSGNETGFRIQRKTGSGGTWEPLAETGANVTSYSDTGLSANTTYFYRVRAYNAAGHSAFSNEAGATTFDTVPAAPSNLVATAVSSSQINLTWQDNSSNETGFKMERKTGSGGTWSSIGAVQPANATSYSNSGLAANTTYFYRVRATNSGGDSAYSNEASATTNGTVPAGLLVYEGFDCAGADQSALQGQAGATSIGFDAASTWGTPVGTITSPETLDDIARYNTTGLTIGSGATSLQVVGGSMKLTHLPHASRYYISRALDVAVTGGETVYGAYLMNYVTRNAACGRVSVDNPAGNDASRYHFGGGFGQWNNANTIGYIPGVGNTSVTGMTGTNPGGPNLTGTNVGLGTTAITLFSITNVGGTSGSSLMWQYVLTSAQFDNFKAGGLTESELQAAATGTAATQVLQRASFTLAAPNPYPQWGLSDVLTFWWVDKALLEVIKLDEIRLAKGANGLDAVTPVAAPPGGFTSLGTSYASWATTNDLSANPADDSNDDGVANGLAYFMNMTGLATNPAINSAGQVTWPNGGNIPSSAYGSEFVVQTSSDLQTWTDVVGTGPAADPNLSNIAGSVSYSLTGASPRFVRLKVAPNPASSASR